MQPLYIAVSWIIVQLHALLAPIFGTNSGAAWGLAIVGLVILIRIILIPLFVKQIKSQRALQALQPQMKAIQNKFKDDRQKQSEELMKLYRDHKTNPFASCLPILAQAPIFFALFRVLNGIGQDRGFGVLKGRPDLVDSAAEATIFGAPIAATFLGSTTAQVKIVTLILIAGMSATTFITQRQLMMKGMPAASLQNNPMVQQQKILMYVFPVIFAVTGVNFPVGVLIYWMTTNFWTMGQQMYVIRRNPTPGSPAYDEWEKRQAAKKGPAAPTTETTTIVEEAPEVKGQRPQPKRAKKKRKK
jgi:YidC/Oxa1 family membrane protein insertase